MVKKVACRECGKDITAYRHGARYCGNKCRSKANNKVVKEEIAAGIRERRLRKHERVNCVKCGRAFVQSRNTQVYCSKECRIKTRQAIAKVRLDNGIDDLI